MTYVTHVLPRITTARLTQTLTVDAEVVLAAGAATITLILPSVAKTAGKIYSFRVIKFGGNVVIDTADSIYPIGAVATTSIILDALGSYLLLYSDGIAWFELSGSHA